MLMSGLSLQLYKNMLEIDDFPPCAILLNTVWLVLYITVSRISTSIILNLVSEGDIPVPQANGLWFHPHSHHALQQHWSKLNDYQAHGDVTALLMAVQCYVHGWDTAILESTTEGEFCNNLNDLKESFTVHLSVSSETNSDYLLVWSLEFVTQRTNKRHFGTFLTSCGQSLLACFQCFQCFQCLEEVE